MENKYHWKSGWWSIWMYLLHHPSRLLEIAAADGTVDNGKESGLQRNVDEHYCEVKWTMMGVGCCAARQVATMVVSVSIWVDGDSKKVRKLQAWWQEATILKFEGCWVSTVNVELVRCQVSSAIMWLKLKLKRAKFTGNHIIAGWNDLQMLHVLEIFC